MTPTRIAPSQHARRAALAGLALIAVAAGLIATPQATAPEQETSADVTVQAESAATPTGSLTRHTRRFWNTTTTARVTGDGARIRTRPSRDGVILGLVPAGATMTIRCTDLGRDRDRWGEAMYLGIRGWVHASLWVPTSLDQQVPRCGTR